MYIIITFQKRSVNCTDSHPVTSCSLLISFLNEIQHRYMHSLAVTLWLIVFCRYDVVTETDFFFKIRCQFLTDVTQCFTSSLPLFTYDVRHVTLEYRVKKISLGLFSRCRLPLNADQAWERTLRLSTGLQIDNVSPDIGLYRSWPVFGPDGHFHLCWLHWSRCQSSSLYQNHRPQCWRTAGPRFPVTKTT